MQLDAWTTSGNPADAARRKRLTIGYVVGALTVGTALSFITYSAHGQVFEQDETIDVSLADAPVIPDEPEPEPEPEPVKVEPKKKKRRPGKLSLSTPTGVPDGVPDEADPNANPYDEDYDDAFDGEGGGGGPQKPPPVVVKKKAPPPPPPAPVLVSEREHSKAPVPVSQPRPGYPAEAKSEGVEGTVVVQFLVTPSGTVGDVRVVRGDPRLSAAVVEAVKRWRFEPGTFQGRPVAMWRSASFPFRLKT
jgi:protein TonB